LVPPEANDLGRAGEVWEELGHVLRREDLGDVLQHLGIVESRRFIQRLVRSARRRKKVSAQRLATPRGFDEEDFLTLQRRVEREASTILGADVLPCAKVLVAATAKADREISERPVLERARAAERAVGRRRGLSFLVEPDLDGGKHRPIVRRRVPALSELRSSARIGELIHERAVHYSSRSSALARLRRGARLVYLRLSFHVGLPGEDKNLQHVVIRGNTERDGGQAERDHYVDNKARSKMNKKISGGFLQLFFWIPSQNVW